MTTTVVSHIAAQAFDFSDMVREVFTEGDCWVLARAIESLTHCPIITINYTENDEWFHVANVLPNGLIVDIDGVFEQEEWLENWAERATLWCPEAYTKEWDAFNFYKSIDVPGFKPYYPDVSVDALDYAIEIARHLSLI